MDEGIQKRKQENFSVPLFLLSVILFFRPSLIKLFLLSGISEDIETPKILVDLLLLALPLFLVTYGAFSRKVSLMIPAWVGALVLWLASILSGVFGWDVFASFEKITELSGGIALMICVATWLKKKEDTFQIVQVILVTATITAIYGIYQYYFGFQKTIEYLELVKASPLDEEHARQVLSARRIFSTMFSPDIFAGFLAMMLPLFLGAIRSFCTWRERFIALCGFLFVLIALYLTGSLGGWLAGGLGIGLWCFFAVRSSRQRTLAVVVVLVLTLAISAGILARRSETLLDFHHQENPFVGRLMFWEAGLKTAFAKPLLGVGAGNYGLAYLQFMREGAEKSRYAHSHWINVLAETGVVGLLGWGWLIYCFIAGGWKKIRESAYQLDAIERWLMPSIFTAGLVFLAHGLIDYDMEIPETAGFFWAFMGLIASKEVSLGGGATSVPKGAAKISLGIFSLTVGILTLLRFPGEMFLSNGEEYMRMGETRLARWSFSQAVRWRPYDSGALMKRANAWDNSPDGVRMAVQDLRKALSFTPSNPIVLWRLGIKLFQAGDYEGALDASKTLALMMPSLKDAKALEHLSTAKILIKRRKYEEARAHLEEVLKIFPNHKGALEGLEELDYIENSFKK